MRKISKSLLLPILLLATPLLAACDIPYLPFDPPTNYVDYGNFHAPVDIVDTGCFQVSCSFQVGTGTPPVPGS